MANTNKTKVGSINPDAIMFDSLSGVYNLDLTNGLWEVNNGWEVEFIDSRIIKITKFKIDTWGIRKLILSNLDDYNKSLQYQVKVSGLAKVHERVNFTRAYCGNSGYDVDWKAGKYTYGNYISGLGIQGGRVNNNTSVTALQMGMHPWDIGGKTNISDGYVLGTWFDASYYAWTIGLFGGVQDSTSSDYEKIWDISDIPIIIDIGVNHLNPASKECWNIKAGETDLYYKDKTFENCWEKYCNITEETTPTGTKIKVISNTSLGVKNSIYLPPLESLISIPKNIAWRVQLYNTEYWNDIKSWYLNNSIDANILPGKLFSDSNISGEITLNVTSDTYYAAHGEDLFRNSGIQKVNFVLGESVRMGSCNCLFRGASKLTQVTTNTPFMANDLSGMFEWCSSLLVFPKGLINWTAYGAIPKVNMGYCWDGCTKLTTIESETEDRNSISNTIVFRRYAQQCFYNCQKLSYIGPVLDFKAIVPHKDDNTYLLFSNCSSLTDVRIKNLNHGDWKLDGTGDLGNLSLLNQDSILYLFNNLTDLVSEFSTEIEEDDVDTPSVNSANLYCPSSWNDYITDSMIIAANAKGWNIYVGGILREVELQKSITVTWIPTTDSGEVDTSIPFGTSGNIVFFVGLGAHKATIVNRLNDRTQMAYLETMIKTNTPTVYTKFTSGDNETIELSNRGSIAFAYWDRSLSTYTANDIYTGHFTYKVGEPVEVRINSIACKNYI